MGQKLRAMLAVCTMLLLVACATTQPVMNVTQAPVNTNKQKPSMDEIRQAVIRAGAGLGWQMKADKAGHIAGTLMLRTHTAVVDIDYSQTAYNIKYRESTNLDYADGKIHRNYNGWIQNLDKAIKAQLLTL